MPRRTKEEMMKTRNTLLKTALDIFYEKGFSRTSLDEIAKRAGFTRGAIYWHFKNKIDLIVELARDLEAAGDDSTQYIISQYPSNLDEIRDMIIRYLRLFDTNLEYKKFYEIVYYHTEWTDELLPLRDFYNGRVKQFLDWSNKSLSMLQDKGLIRPNLDCDSISVGLNALIEGLISTSLTGTATLPQSCKTEQIIDIYLDGMKSIS